MREQMAAAIRGHLAKVGAAFETWALWVLNLGVGALTWVLLLGGATGVGVTLSAPKFALALHPKFGPGAVVAAFACGALLVTLLLARRSSAPFSEAFRGAVVTLRRWLTPVLLVLVGVVASKGLEREHPFIVISLGALAAWASAQWVLAWVGTESGTSAATRTAPSALGRLPTWWPWIALGLLVCAYTAATSTLSINNHLGFNTGRADLGFYVSIFRRSSLGDLLGCTICGGGNHLSGHFDPILVLLSPLYLLYPEAETVLVLQSLLLGSTMIPLYLIGRQLRLGAGVALGLCLCFALHPALYGINLFDFHSLALVVPGAMWLLWAREAARWTWYWVFVALFLTIREDAALILVVIGADSLLSHRRFGIQRGLLTILIGVAYFVLVKTLILDGGDPLNPSTGRGYAYYYKDLVPKGTGTMGLVNTVLSNPAKVIPLLLQEGKVLYWLQLLTPVLFLPLLAHRGRLLLFYGAAFTLLASREHVYSVHFHYSSVILPFVFYVTAVALGRPRRLGRRLSWLTWTRAPAPRITAVALAACLAVTAVTSWRFGGLLPNRTFHAGFKPLQRKPTEADLRRDAMMKEVCRIVPKGTTVAASEPNLPHLGRCSGYVGKAKRHLADYLIWGFTRGSATPEILAEMKKGYWEEVRAWGNYKLLKNRFPKDYVAPKKGRAARGVGPGKKSPMRANGGKAPGAPAARFGDAGAR
jgi:uncharacterized membrane protein